MSNQMWDWFPMPRIYAFTSKKKARKLIKRKTGMEDALHWIGKAAQMDYFKKGGEESFAVITFGDEARPSHRAALLAHECSHVVDSWLEDIGEGSAGEEIRAYAIQCAMLSALSQLGEEWLTPQT